MAAPIASASRTDAASASLIQGMTLAGVLFDEVALQNREFVEQAVARCSVEGSRLWFSCNPERFHSVRNGLHFLSDEIGNLSGGDEKTCVAVHDGVRPFVAPEVIDRCFAEAEVSGAAIPVVPVVDSLREFSGESSRPVDRSRYQAVQTPQVFDYDLLLKAYEQPYSEFFTDDASVVEAFGHTVKTVPGNRENIKITTPFDLLVAKALLAK